MSQWRPEVVAQPSPVPIGVDCHVHLFPDALFDAIGRWFAAAGWELPYPCRTDDALRLLPALGVEQFWALPYAHKAGVAAELNRYIAGVARANPTVVGFFTVHPDDADPAALARQALDDLGLKGMKLHCQVQGMAVDDPRLDGAFDLLEARGAPCVLHAANAPYPGKIERLDASHTENRLRRNPQLKAVIGHLGAPQTREFMALLPQYPNLHLEVSFAHVQPVSTVPGFAPDELAPFADRILFGSDFPYITFPYSMQVESWLRAPWVRERQADFFGGTANRLLGSHPD
jgi:predicted TIM-barrel fold metal-dependent hydrolase